MKDLESSHFKHSPSSEHPKEPYLKDTTVNIKHETFISTFASIKCPLMFLTLLIDRKSVV